MTEVMDNHFLLCIYIHTVFQLENRSLDLFGHPEEYNIIFLIPPSSF